MGETMGGQISFETLLLGLGLILLGLALLLQVIPMEDAPMVLAVGAAVVGLYAWVVKHHMALGLLLVGIGIGGYWYVVPMF